MKPNIVFVVDDPNVRDILDGSFGPRGLTVVTQDPAAGGSVRLSGLTPQLARDLTALFPPSSHPAPTGVHLAAQQAVTDAFLGNGSRRDVTARVVRSLAETLGWDFATVWTCRPPAARITCTDVWNRDPEAQAEFRTLTQGVSFAPGTDASGRVWETGTPIWIEDLETDSSFLRGGVAARAGLTSAVLVAYKAGDRVSGVIEILSCLRRPRDEQTLQLVEYVAAQLAAYLERAERQEQRHLLAAALDFTHELVAVLDRDGRLMDINDAGRQLMGVSASQSVAGRELPQPEWAQRFLRNTALPAALADGAWLGETALLDPRAGEVAALTELIAHRGPDGVVKHLFGTFRRIDDLVQVKRRVWQAEKLEALARLAGAVANDFNNMLTVISGYSHLVAETLPIEDQRRDQLAQLDLASQQAGALIHRLATIAAQPSGERAPVDVWAMLHDMTRLIRSLAGSGIEVMLVRETYEGLVLGDPVQLEQIVVNLVDNARDALPRGGRITLTVSHSTVEEGGGPGLPLIPPGKYVVLAVTDTGSGMSAATQARLFEPFFTTKVGARGLGLASVLGAARQAGGYVAVQSESGRGSTFCVYLPRLDSSAIPVQAPANQRAESSGTETVLIVEDEAGVRALARRSLERNGYRVLEADNGATALTLCAQHSGPLHIALIDMVMPGMGGDEVAERMALLRPDIRILFMTGHSESAVALHRSLPPGTHILDKPFVPGTLVRAVRAALDRVSSRRRSP